MKEYFLEHHRRLNNLRILNSIRNLRILNLTRMDNRPTKKSIDDYLDQFDRPSEPNSPEGLTEFPHSVRCLRLSLETLANNEKMYRDEGNTRMAHGILKVMKEHEKAIEVLKIAGSAIVDREKLAGDALSNAGIANRALTEDPTWLPPQCERDKQARVEHETKTHLENAGYLNADALGRFDNGEFMPPKETQPQGKLSLVADGMLSTVETMNETVNAILKRFDTVGQVDGKTTTAGNTQDELWKEVSTTGNLTTKFRFVHNELTDILLRLMDILAIQKKLL